jgi:hypothetical protein
MINEEDFADASEVTPEMAFVRLERKFRSVFQDNISDVRNNEAYRDYVREYANHTIAAATTLGLHFLDDFDVEISDEELSKNLGRLTTAVDRFAVHTQITYIRRPPKESVALEATEKRILRHYVEQIKEVIDNSSLLVAKKERLFDKINDFLLEVDRDRTRLQKFNDIVISIAHTGGEAAEELEPSWKWVKLIAKVLGAREENEQVKLPKPHVPKKLEAPKKTSPAPAPKPASRRGDLDDEIPF